MGDQNVQRGHDDAALRRFTWHLLQDVRALEQMLEEERFETGIRRIGAEQELFFVDERCQPAPVVEAVLEGNDDPRLVTELTRFNAEFNLDAQRFGGDCLRRMERQLHELLDDVRARAERAGARVVLMGILPTITLSDLSLDNMTPSPRYYALNDAIVRLRGGPAATHIRGVDELFVKHDSIMLEGCNTSFQTHFQVAPDEFARFYNIAQAVAAPVLAAAVNSPIFFGKRLWHETRIALFQQAVDTRSTNLYLREMSPRVHFGTRWVERSVTEIFKEDIARFRVLITPDDAVEDPFAALAEGRAPRMRALQLHNSTVYRWNRACYGITDGEPHLRIENRILPAGPTPLDEMANAAFWFGLVSGLAREVEDVRTHLAFDDARGNLVAAARLGLAAQLTWLDGRRQPAPDLILDTLLPLAHDGLAASGIDRADAEHFLGVIEARVTARQTGADWQLASLAAMQGHGTRAERLASLVDASIEHERSGEPVHTWPLARLAPHGAARRLHATRVEHYMTTDLYTVNEDELVELVASLMDWQRIRHVLVEDRAHHLCGLVTHRNLLRYLSEHGPLGPGRDGGTPVKEIMIRDPLTVGPDTSTLEAIRLMRDHRVGALPVVRDGQLLGIVTERDFIHIAGQLLDESVAADERTGRSEPPASPAPASANGGAAPSNAPS